MTPQEALAAALKSAARNFYGAYEDWPDKEALADTTAYVLPHVLAALAAAGFAIVPADTGAALPVDGIVAELMGVEAHLDEARERLIKTNLTLAALARLPEEEGPHE